MKQIILGLMLILAFCAVEARAQRSRPKLGGGSFTGILTMVFREGKRVTSFYVDAEDYRLELDAQAAVVSGGSLSEGARVRVTYKNLKNSESDIGRWFTGRAVRVVVLKSAKRQ